MNSRYETRDNEIINDLQRYRAQYKRRSDRFLAGIKPILENIRFVIIPRLTIELEEQEFVGKLVVLEKSLSNFEYSYNISRAFFGFDSSRSILETISSINEIMKFIQQDN